MDYWLLLVWWITCTRMQECKHVTSSSGCCWFLVPLMCTGQRVNSTMQTINRHYNNNIWAKTWQNQWNEFAPREDSGQPGHLPSVISLAVRMKKPWVLSYPLSPQQRLQTGWMPRLIWVFAGRTLILLVLWCRVSFIMQSHNITAS